MQFSQRNRSQLMQKRLQEERRIKESAIEDRWRSERRRQKRRKVGEKTVRARVLASGRRRSLRVERADALSDVSYRNYASDRSRAQISRNLGALHSTAVSIPRPPPCLAPLAPQTPCIQSPPPCPGRPHNYKGFQTVTFSPNQDERFQAHLNSRTRASRRPPHDRLYPLLATRYRRFDYFLQA